MVFTEEYLLPTILFNQSTPEYRQLHTLIKQTRNQMIQSALATGFTSPETIQLSQKLDYYLNIELKQRNNHIHI
jgi:hypothetical protein